MSIHLIVSILLFTCFHGFGQNPTKTALDSAVYKMAALIDLNYVFEKKGRSIAHHLIEQHKSGRFLHAQNWKEFALLTTQVLQDFSKDGHLYVIQDPETVATLQGKKPEVAQDSTEAVIRKRASNYGYKEVKILDGNIGYIKMTEVVVSEESLPIIFAALQFVANTKALIIDLQDNGGGGSETGPIFESIFLPKNTPLLEFNLALQLFKFMGQEPCVLFKIPDKVTLIKEATSICNIRKRQIRFPYQRSSPFNS